MRSITLLSLALSFTEVYGFWRLSCGQIQTGRLDPIVNPGVVSGHTHVIAGAYNINISSTYDTLQQSFCTSCAIQADKSAYWTPLLYYRTAAGQFKNVPNDGTVVYYLGRGEGSENTVPFPKGFRMVSGNPYARSYDANTKAGTAQKPGSPISDRVSFICLKANYDGSRSSYMNDTDCQNGLRAQITFPSCWDGVNLYKQDQSHVAYLSNIENGACPPTHPKRIPHLFYELYYFPNRLDTSDGGKFVFAQGDPTGYGFHGDFQNGWDMQVLTDGISQCLEGNSAGNVEDCPPFQPTYDSRSSSNCPEQPSYFNEPVKGSLTELPGCNPVQTGPAAATSVACSKNPSRTNAQKNLDGVKRSWPTAGTTKYTTTVGTATFRGCFPEPSSGRLYTLGSKADDGMSIETCAAFCKTKNAAWFGIEYARECYCGNAAPSTSSLAVSQCNFACSGDITQWCGAGKKLSVYQLSGSTSRVKRNLLVEMDSSA